MKMAFVLFDGMTTLDFAGFYEAITWMGIMGAKENVTWDFCSNKEEITDDRGLTVKVTHVYPDLSDYDLLFVPGGFSTRSLRFDSAFITWLQTSANVTYKVSVCTGALLLGAAGFLHEKKATTNPSAYELLTPYCSEVVKKRIVRDGNLFTGGGVSASIDLGLFVIESLTDSLFVQQVQQKMDYPYYQADSCLM
ncbi:DJ-1/PfpI family protein [Paenibacillus sp. Soil724D2]|uniref:DJ-1/PfpI family protein n=1 Tax=Paenibacillus sp. (strain Soil724D2) TaxID=1736392 RepID=UPI0007161134|nr:DJ-1/PfpI family protein [Paenibacillus sp. Soil724D2]KRE52168.1 thiamine biosynthesis protein ThiJ [Paenibacillus sp. Soil724D2]